ncbi:ArsR/SmtB family transcription factor [Microlunatus capsulatus]|uniref:DNA-binding transcriptional ArsR family regulator n=1 Tax=Microlunatus capsulatus TaxID=99117 RepID=A0ABS4ZDF9_9ACTN|nr:helix-turn-helix domain-containing protein [Microlunatus capsulatus]MBP2419071.1 DNA-binding transcriptional ArsR family regulator [Microlunatus capsulatus]
MVVDQQGGDADRVFAALADATRRDIVLRVLQHAESVSALASRYAMSFAAVQKHVAVLERAGLVSKERRGREQLVSGRIDAVRAAARSLQLYEEIWRGRIGRMEDLLAEPLREDAAWLSSAPPPTPPPAP